MTPPPAPDLALAPPAPALREHSFVFADLVGFTAMTEAEGDWRAAEVALEFFARVRPLLAAHGAHEVKTIGDAMMLRVGDATAATRLAHRIVGAVAAGGGLPAVRVGVDTGSAVERGDDFYGGAVNRAAKLCAAAEPDGVLVSAATWAAARRRRRAGRARRQRPGRALQAA